jgi:hypothetical protein
MWNRLKRVRLETDSIMAELNNQWIPKTVLKNAQDFSQCFKTFTLALKKDWYELILSIRRGCRSAKEENVIEIIEIVESKSPFVAKEFEHWLNYKKKNNQDF